MNQSAHTLSVNYTVVDTEQKNVEATMAVTKRHEPLRLKKVALAPSPLPTVQKATWELAPDVSSFKQEMSTFKQDSAHPSKSKNPFRRDPDEAWKY